VFAAARAALTAEYGAEPGPGLADIRRQVAAGVTVSRSWYAAGRTAAPAAYLACAVAQDTEGGRRGRS